MTVAGTAISVIMPVAALDPRTTACAERVRSLLKPGDDCTLVLDGSDGAAPAGCRVVRLARRSGPAVARNRGAAGARGDILFFVDADVLLADGSLEHVRRFFSAGLGDAVFGSYDDDPPEPGAVSRFRNLLHHVQHQRGAGRVASFWTGCGAVRRSLFEGLGGFATTYRRPAMEDLELGLRMAAAGGRVILDPTLRCKHLKRWTLFGMLRSDLLERAIPWSRLLWRTGGAARTLNADRRGQVSVALTGVAGLALLLSPALPSLPAAVAAWAGLLVAQRDLLALLLRRGGPSLLVAGTLLLPLHLAAGGLGFLLVCLERGGLWLVGGRPHG